MANKFLSHLVLDFYSIRSSSENTVLLAISLKVHLLQNEIPRCFFSIQVFTGRKHFYLDEIETDPLFSV